MIDRSNTLVKINSVEKANGKTYVYLTGLVLPEFFEKNDPNIVRSFEVKNYEVDKEKGKYLLTLVLHDEKEEEILVSTFYDDYSKITAA